MKLGLMVTTEELPEVVRGLAAAAVAKGHEVVIFLTDAGTKLLKDGAFAALAAMEGVSMSFCEHSMQRYGGRPAALPAAIRSGSQFENALMQSEADKVVVL